MSCLEKNLLVDLCLKYKNIIENKKTDGATTKSKDETWKILAKEFQANSICHIPRDWKQLKHVCLSVNMSLN